MSVRYNAATLLAAVGANQEKDDAVSHWPPQVMLPPIFLGSEQKSFALALDCDAVSGFNGICQNVGRKETLEKRGCGRCSGSGCRGGVGLGWGRGVWWVRS